MGAKKEYRDRLRQMIDEPEYRLLLNADDYWERDGGGKSRGRAAFMVPPSGHCLKNYISLWEIFDHGEELEELGQEVARIASEIRRDKLFTMIVTCSPPSRLLLQLFHDRIETISDPAKSQPTAADSAYVEDVKIRHLGPEPLHDCIEEMQPFKDEKVLIFADVIASGSVVNKVSRTIKDLGGKSVAVLTCVLSGKDLIRDMKKNKNQKASFGKDGGKIPLYTLAVYPNKPLKDGEYDDDKVLEIVPDTALPEDVPTTMRRTNIFSTRKMFRHFEDSGALGCRMYKVDSQYFNVAVRLPKFFSEKGDILWRKISDIFDQEHTLIATYKRTDILFKGFVEKRLAQDGKKIPKSYLLLRADALASYTYVIPPALRQKAEVDEHVYGKVVILLITTVQTAEKLRNLVSLLASLGVKEIIVLCLFNRMGIHTEDFLARVRALLRGTSGSNGDTSFQFKTVYNMAEIPPKNIRRVEVISQKLFTKYLSSTKVESFRLLAANYRKDFKPLPVTSAAFLSEPPQPLRDGPRTMSILEHVGKQKPRKVEIQVETDAGLLFCLCSNVSLTRNYSPIIDELNHVTRRSTIFTIFGLLLSDIQFIRFKGYFKTLHAVIRKRLRKSQRKRFNLEKRARKNKTFSPELAAKIQDEVELEICFLLGLSLFSDLDEDHSSKHYEKLLNQLLTDGKNAEEWRDDHLLNLLLYLGDDRIVWTLSMVLWLALPDFEDANAYIELKGELKQKLRRFIKVFDAIDPRELKDDWTALGWSEDTATLKLKRLRVNLNSLLTEIGVYELGTKYSVIRFLHKELIFQPSWHSPIAGTLHLVITRIKNHIEENFAEAISNSTTRRIPLRATGKTEKELKNLLEDGMYIAGKLQEIAEAAHRLFEFTPVSHIDAGPFAIESHGSLFGKDVREIGALLQKARADSAISIADLENAEKINRRISENLWDRFSPLQTLLRGYIVDLLEVLILTLEEVGRHLEIVEELTGIFSHELEKLRERGKTEHWEVLVDRPLLREALRNILSNVRHGVNGAVQNRAMLASMIKIELTERETEQNDIKKLRWVRLQVTSPGAFPGERLSGTTLEQQQSEIAEYGSRDPQESKEDAFLKVESSPDGTQTIATLQLRSRRVLAKRMRTIEERAERKKSREATLEDF